MILSAMTRFGEVRGLACRCGPSVFPEGEVRALATCIVTGRPVDTPGLTLGQRQRLALLVDEVGRESLPDELSWGMGILRRYVEDNFSAVLIDVLTFAAEQVRQHQRVSFVRGRVLHAFDIAECTVPFDPNEKWGASHG